MTERLSFAGTVQVDGRRLRGSVQLKGQQTPRNGELVEVDPAAFMKADATTAVLTAGHQAGADMTLGYDPLRTFARVDNGSLLITRTEQGFDYETPDDLPNTTYANDMLELARAKVLGGTSFDVVGLRSTFSTTPDGTRVRRYTSIAAITAIAPVIEPAFPSTVAAFSKESDVTEQIVEEPKAAPPPVPAAEPEAQPKASFSAQAETAEATERFARTLDTAQIENAMDAIVAAAKGELQGIGLDQYEAYAKVYGERKRSDAETRERAARMKALHDIRLGRVPKAPEAELYESDDYKAAFASYIRTGEKSGMEQFAQSIAGDGTQGGYMVPDGFLNRIVETQKAFGGIAGIADTLTTSDGRPLRWPSNDDTANSAVIAAEGVAAASGADKVLGSVELGAYSYDATGANALPLLVSKELLQDAAFDVEAFIGRNLGQRIGRKQAVHFATGSGSSEPKGLLDKTPDTMTATTMFAAVIEHMFQVDSAYRDAGNCRWVLSDTTLAKAYGSVDGNGRPLFIASSDASAAGRPGGFIMGYPVTLDQSAGDLVAFGDIKQGYIIRYVRGVQVDVDPYTNIKTRQVAYHAWARADANIQDSAAYSVSTYASVTADS